MAFLLSQGQADVCENQQDADANNRIISCKHSAARSGMEQAADLMVVFRQLKKSQRRVSLKNMPLTHPMKKALLDALEQVDGTLSLGDDSLPVG